MSTLAKTFLAVGLVAVVGVFALVAIFGGGSNNRCGDYDLENGQYVYDRNDGDYDRQSNNEYVYVGCSDSNRSSGSGFFFFGSSGSSGSMGSSGSDSRGGGPGFGK